MQGLGNEMQLGYPAALLSVAVLDIPTLKIAPVLAYGLPLSPLLYDPNLGHLHRQERNL